MLLTMIVHQNQRKLAGLWLGGCALFVLLVGINRVSAQVINQAIPPVPIYPIPAQVELGPVLDVVPYVLADGVTIQLTLVPSVKEFVGYDPAPNVSIPTQPNTVIVPTILPHFRVRQVVTSVNVWDGQTLVLGGLLSENTTKQKDKVPILGDLPLVGRLFRSESSQSQKRNLLIFVTPTLIDPAGNRLHTDEDMPFAQNAFPPQPAQNPSAQTGTAPSQQPQPASGLAKPVARKP